MNGPTPPYAPEPPTESVRLAALQRLQILDTRDEPAYDEVVDVAARICGAPIALISLVDARRQWFKARVGMPMRETPRDQSFCAYALTGRTPLIVPDAHADPRFRDNPLVTGEPGIRFYAGVPLVTTDGEIVGTLCVIDHVPRELRPDQLEQLDFLAQRVVAMMERHRQASWLDEVLDAAGVGLFTLDVATDTVYPSATCCAIFGLPVKASYPVATLDALVVEADRGTVAAAHDAGATLQDVEFRIVRAQDGAPRYLCRSGRTRIAADGRRTHVVGTLRDVTEKYRDRAEAEARERVLNRHARGLEFVIALSARQRSQTDPVTAMRVTTEALGEHLKADRVGFYRVLAADAVQYLGGWTQGSLPMLSGFEDGAARGPAVARHRDTGEPLVYTDSRHELDGALAPAASQGVLAGMVVPLLGLHRWHAGLYIDSATVRSWRPDEVALVREVAELGWLAVERAEALLRLQDRLGRQDTQLAIGRAEIETQTDARRSAEAQVHQLQKMDSVGMLAGGIAHDFNNMLAVIIGSMNLMERKLARGESAELAPHVESALEAARRAATLTSRLLSFSRQQPLAPKAVDVNRLIGGMTDLLARTLGETIRLEVVQTAGLWMTHADPAQLEAVLLNLSVNARDAMPDGGRLTIESANSNVDAAYAAEHDVPIGPYVRISVSDTGCGIPAEILSRVFDPFFTTKPVGRGTGLGLSQAFGFARQSGGHIRVYSEPGHGSCFHLYLPRRTESSDPDTASTASRIHASTTPRRARRGTAEEVVLVVEDEDRMRHVTVEALRELGYTAIEAAGPLQALAVLADGRQAVSLLFTDIVMPDLSGRQLADRVRETHPDLPVLFTTGYTRNAIVHNGVLDPGTHFLAKPFSIDELAAKVAEVLDKR